MVNPEMREDMARDSGSDDHRHDEDNVGDIFHGRRRPPDVRQGRGHLVVVTVGVMVMTLWTRSGQIQGRDLILCSQKLEMGDDAGVPFKDTLIPEQISQSQSLQITIHQSHIHSFMENIFFQGL